MWARVPRGPRNIATCSDIGVVLTKNEKRENRSKRELITACLSVTGVISRVQKDLIRIRCLASGVNLILAVVVVGIGAPSGKNPVL